MDHRPNPVVGGDRVQRGRGQERPHTVPAGRTDSRLSPITLAHGFAPAHGSGGRTGLVCLACLEILWLAWYLVVPLQNVIEPRKSNPTGLSLAQGASRGRARHALPLILYWASSFSSSVTLKSLPQRIPIVLTAGLIAAAAIGLGDLALGRLRLRDRLGLGERIALDYGVGTAFLGVTTLIIGRMGWLDPRFIRTGLGVIAILGLMSAWPRGRRGTAKTPGLAPGGAISGEPRATAPPRATRSPGSSASPSLHS